MIRHFLRNTNNTKSFYSTISHNSTSQEKWDIQAAVCLEKKPVVSPKLEGLEREFQTVLSEIEVEKSVKSDFEIRHENDVRQLEILKKGGELSESELTLTQTAQDLVDIWTEELKQFQSKFKVMENDKKSRISKILEKHLVLLVNKKIGNNYHTLPFDYWREGETLRESAERILKSNCGNNIAAQIYGNAPCGFYKYKYPIDVRNQNGKDGAKVFIYFARYLKGSVPEGDDTYKWSDRTELGKLLHPECHKAVSQFLITE